MERKYDVVIKGANVFSIGSNIDIGIKDGMIIDLMPGIEISDEGTIVINAINKILIPGYVAF
jgi:N-acyl-D-aspartate/D-glutamate deacylase